MSSNIVITNNTTSESLFQEIYDQNPSDFGQIYADLISSNPEYKDLINDSWAKSSSVKMSFDEFRQTVFQGIMEKDQAYADEDYDLFGE